jgi:radical SAM superfamily enzyme YgiQ (UPF0313 family)
MDINKDDTVHYPHDEMTTLLLPVTLGCSYNKCKFCSMYKDAEHKRISIDEIKAQLINGYLYTEKIFLTGADPLSIGFDAVVQILDLIKLYLPYCGRVACYASIRGILTYSVEELSVLHDKGLRLLYIGFETGRDDILRLMNKPHKVEDAINAGKNLNKANLMFNSIIMYGIAGKGESVENAIATAKMINQFHVNSIITMNLIVFEGTELSNMVKKGEFIPPDKNERLLEVKTLLENLNPKKETIFDTTHPTNIIKIKGNLPQDKEKLIREVNNLNNIQ